MLASRYRERMNSTFSSYCVRYPEADLARRRQLPLGPSELALRGLS